MNFSALVISCSRATLYSFCLSCCNATNTELEELLMLNKAASQSTSLYQQCSSLRARLMRVHDFPQFFSLALSSEASSSRRSTDPVTQLWDCFALGVPLCYLYNLLPHPPHRPIDLDVDPESDGVRNLADRDRKRAIALFNIAVKSLNHGEGLQVRDIWERENTDGFVKVRIPIDTNTAIYSNRNRSSTW